MNIQPMDSSRWHSIEEVAEYLGVKATTLYKWIERKDMPAHKVGRLWRFKLQEVDEWVKANSTQKKAKGRQRK